MNNELIVSKEKFDERTKEKYLNLLNFFLFTILSLI